MDISSLNTSVKSEDGVWMTVEDEFGEPFYINENPVRIKVLGSNSSEVKKVRRAHQAKMMQHMNRNGKFSEKEIEGTERNNLEVAVAATEDWENMVFEDQELDCTASNVRKVYKHADLVKNQVLSFLDDTTNFTENSSES